MTVFTGEDAKDPRGRAPGLRDRVRALHGVSAVLALMVVAGSLVSGQIPFQPGWKYRSGQNVVPAFEGWQRNADGSFDMIFGYFNRNYEETLDIQTGPDNSMEPGGPDQGQPTFFLAARRRFFFAVRVPKDWPPTRKLVWSLTVRGRTEKATGFLLPEWEVDTSTIQGSLTAVMDPLNKRPTISVGPEQNQTVTFPNRATLTVSATDDGRPVRRSPPTAAAAPTGRGASPEGRSGQPDRPDPGRQGSGVVVANLTGAVVAAGLRVDWVQYRGPVGGRVTFNPATTPVADGNASTTASFSLPGRYVVRAFANDGAVTTPADITVVVSPSSQNH